MKDLLSNLGEIAFLMDIDLDSLFQRIQAFTRFKSTTISRDHLILSKTLTLDFIETLDLFFRRVCYHQNASYRKMKRIKVVHKL